MQVLQQRPLYRESSASTLGAQPSVLMRSLQKEASGRSDARHQAAQQMRSHHATSTASIVHAASLLQQGHLTANPPAPPALHRQSSAHFTPQRRRPSSAHSSRHPDLLMQSQQLRLHSQQSSSGQLLMHHSWSQTTPTGGADAPGARPPVLRTQSLTRTSLNGGLASSPSLQQLPGPATAALLTDGSESRMFQQLSRSGIIKPPPNISGRLHFGRPTSARPSSGAANEPSSASAALAAVRATVAASARELLSALAAGTSSDQLIRLGMLEPGLAWGGYGSTSFEPEPEAAAQQGAVQRGMGTTYVHMGQDIGGWTPVSAEHPAPVAPVVHCALTQVELEQLAESRLQKCCVWVVNRVPEQCCICLDVMHLDESVVMTNCGHRLHKPCLRSHLTANHACSLLCPICRAALVAQ